MKHFGGAGRVADRGGTCRLTSPIGAAVAALLLVVGAWAAPVSAGPTMIDFEALADGDVPGLIAGASFTNATAISAGVSLNEAEFPPHSGSSVVFDAGSPLIVLFSVPVTSVFGYFNYLAPLTLSFTPFDPTDALGLVYSAFASNTAISGEPGSSPNEMLGLTWAKGIAALTITGDPSGSSFTLDDLTFESVANAVPEPSSLALLAVGLLGMRQRRGAGLL